MRRIRIISSRKKQGQFIAAPVVSGNTTIGSVLSVTNGVFDGPTSTYTYQWFLEGSPISGATSNTYTLPALSNGVLRCVVKATNSRGSVKSTSNFFIIRNSFDFVVKTDNISSGSSTATQFKLPLVSTGTYNCTVYWGDGTSSVITAWDQAQTTKTYANAGTYNISITGTLTGWRFANTGDRLKFLTVKWWGNGFRPGNYDSIFRSCENLTLDNVRDVLDTTGMTTFYYLFQNCLSLVKVNRINEWNTTNITYMGQAFDSCIKFNDNIGNWDMSNNTTFDRMFAHAGAFNNGGSPDINNWNTGNVTFMRFMFGTDGTVPGGTIMTFNQPIGNWDMSKVTNMYALFNRNPYFNQDISTKTVTKNGVTYTAWDTKEVTEMPFMFNCQTIDGQFNQNIGNWNTSKVNNISQMFGGQPYFNQDLSTKVVTIGGNTYTAWDTKEVVTMNFVFYSYGNAAQTRLGGQFNQNIGNWNTSKATTIASMFFNQPAFNQDISTKVVTVGASTYTAWDTSNVTSFSSLFGVNLGSAYPGKFNQNIGNWNTSKVTTIANMFFNQTSFNQNISTKVVTVGASTYTAWDTKEVTTMGGMFAVGIGIQGVFNQNIGNWNTSKTTAINGMFQNQPAFNQDISTKTVTVGASTYTSWDTLNVTLFRYMFYNNLANSPSQFDQNIGNWNTIKGTEMIGMFFNARSFNQNIGNWRVNLVTAFNGTGSGIADTFADYSGLSQTNYDALLIGWSSRPVLANKAINFGTTKYSSAAVAARAILTSAPNSWTIIDGGQI